MNSTRLAKSLEGFETLSVFLYRLHCIFCTTFSENLTQKLFIGNFFYGASIEAECKLFLEWFTTLSLIYQFIRFLPSEVWSSNFGTELSIFDFLIANNLVQWKTFIDFHWWNTRISKSVYLPLLIFASESELLISIELLIRKSWIKTSDHGYCGYLVPIPCSDTLSEYLVPIQLFRYRSLSQVN